MLQNRPKEQLPPWHWLPGHLPLGENFKIVLASFVRVLFSSELTKVELPWLQEAEIQTVINFFSFCSSTGFFLCLLKSRLPSHGRSQTPLLVFSGNTGKVKSFLKFTLLCQSQGKEIGELFEKTPAIQLPQVNNPKPSHRQELDSCIFRTRLFFGFPFDE